MSNSLPNSLITALLLLVGISIGLIIGIRLGRAQSGGSSTDLATLKALLEKSEERLKDAEGKNESQAKIATQMEEMRTTVERMRVQAQDASEKRIQSETELKGTINEMRLASSSLFDETRKIAGALSNSQSRGKFGEAQLELLSWFARRH